MWLLSIADLLPTTLFNFKRLPRSVCWLTFSWNEIVFSDDYYYSLFYTILWCSLPSRHWNRGCYWTCRRDLYGNNYIFHIYLNALIKMFAYSFLILLCIGKLNMKYFYGVFSSTIRFWFCQHSWLFPRFICFMFVFYYII